MGRIAPFGRSSRGIATGVAGFCLLAHPAAAQYAGDPYSGGVLPNVGTDVRMGDLRPQLERYFQPNAPLSTTPAWLIQPSLGVDIGLTDNANRGQGPKRADVFTNLSPQLVLSGDTARIKASAVYSPTFTIYASQSNQTTISQFGNAQALGTIIPNTLFLDVRGNVSQSSLTGYGTNQYATSTNNRRDTVQTTSFSVTPYAEHRFGGWGTARLGYSYSRTLQDAQDNQTAQYLNALNNQSGLGTPGYGAIGNLTTQRERASFSSGENLGRFNDLLVAEAFQYKGGGSYAGAYRNQVSNELGFALTRQITLLAGVGYQDLRYGGVPIYRISEPTWNVGTRYTPTPDSTITVIYGRRDGATNVSFDGQFSPTPRTRLIGRYSTGITTDIEEAQNVLSTTSVGPTGLVTDTATGAPVSGGSITGVQNGIYRVKRLSLNGLFLANRDSYSLGFTLEDRTTLTNSTTLFGNGQIPAGTKSTSAYVTGSWQHDLAPDMNTLVSAQYGTTNSTQQLLVGAGGQQQRTISLTAALNKQFTETLTGSLRYTFSQQTGGQNTVSSPFGTGNYTENVLLVGLRKSF